MKKKERLIIICILLVVVIFTGCGSDKSSNTGKTEKKVDQEKYLTFTAGGVGGSWYIIAASLNEAFENNIAGLKLTIVPGAGVSNPTVVNRGTQAQIGLSYAGDVLSAMQGVEGYKEKHTSMMAIANLNMKQYFTLMIAADLGVKNFDEIIAQKLALKIAVGPRGSGSEQMTRRVLNEHGISYADIKKWG